jgi:hypothetical protein
MYFISDVVLVSLGVFSTRSTIDHGLERASCWARWVFVGLGQQ